MGAYDKIMDRLVSQDDCWITSYVPHNHGYIAVRYNGHRDLGHRIVWEHHNGPIPDGLMVRHKCDNPPCVNPDHLLIGTTQDNTADRVERGRTPCGDEHWCSKLESGDVLAIRASSAKQVELAKQYEVSEATISRIVNHKLWRNIE